MIVYIWKDPNGVPFYIGLTKNIRRSNPRNSGGRNWLCKKKLAKVGVDMVTVEIRHVASVEEGQKMEKNLIDSIGRVQLSNGPLTNLAIGGNGVSSMPESTKEKLRQALLDPSHPVHSKESREKQRLRMKDPDVQEKISGENNPSKRLEVREKLKNLWQTEAYRERQKAARSKPRTLTDETKQMLRKNLKNNDAMQSWGIRNADPEFLQKRLDALKNPEVQKRKSESLRRSWAKRKGILLE